jgi:hypothetical protein
LCRWPAAAGRLLSRRPFIILVVIRVPRRSLYGCPDLFGRECHGWQGEAISLAGARRLSPADPEPAAGPPIVGIRFGSNFAPDGAAPLE